LLAWAFWRRSWLAGFTVLNVGIALKVIWSFFYGFVGCNGLMLIVWHTRRRRIAPLRARLP
jgi:hypothetical protein